MPGRLAAAMLLTLGACGGEREPAPAVPEDAATPAAERAGEASPYWDPGARLTRDELERGRRDPSWREVVTLDEDTEDAAPTAASERWDDISAEALNSHAMVLPLGNAAEGPSVLRVQILLDRALFSPGVLDGYWGKNSEKAVYWFQRREGLSATGRLNRATFERLAEVARVDEPVRVHQLTSEDVAGPFVALPDDIYERAQLECTCYESLTEKLAELFHTTPAVLAQLNPGVELEGLAAGDPLRVPAIRTQRQGTVPVAQLVVSVRGHFVHARDADDRVLYHFPSTLGSAYSPSPTGDFRVTSITEDPWWHYQPRLLPHVDDDDPDARIPPGPNNAVGRVWMALSAPHYGIHGTNAPETIGYVTSAGCVRLTNWDALFLARSIEAGVPVRFTDT